MCSQSEWSMTTMVQRTAIAADSGDTTSERAIPAPYGDCLDYQRNTNE